MTHSYPSQGHPLPPTPDTSGQFRLPDTAPRRRKVWPWIMAAVVIGLAAAGALAAWLW